MCSALIGFAECTFGTVLVFWHRSPALHEEGFLEKLLHGKDHRVFICILNGSIRLDKNMYFGII